ncbi:MAG: hypothetical protein GXO93_06435 [FCB group bacterium]|nr:hypothetical protein [FCB group bacterium]
MKQSWLKAFVLLISISSITYVQSFAQNDTIIDTSYQVYDFDFTGGGARAEGMGKAFLGISDDITGGSWNPAGIFELDGPIVGISWASLLPRGTSNATFWSHSLKSNNRGSFNTISSFNLVAPVRIKGHPFVGSFNYVRDFNAFQQLQVYGSDSIPRFIYIRYNNRIDTTFRDTLLNEVYSHFQLDGGLYSLNFAIGTRLYNKISFGVSGNVYTGKALWQVNNKYLIYDNPFDPFGTQRGLAEFNTTVIDTNKFNGFNATIGFKYNGEKFDAGLVIRTPFTLNEKYVHTIYRITKFNGLVRSQQTDTTYYGDRLTKYEIPLIIGAGFGYHLRDNFLLAADAEYRKFSGKKIKIRTKITIDPSGSNQETYLVLDPHWNNVFTFRLGSEYLWDTKYGEIPLRTGFGFIPLPAPNVSASGDTTTAVRYNFSVGTGIHWSQISLDIAYTYSYLDQSFGNHGGLENIKYDQRNHHLSFSFTGIF